MALQVFHIEIAPSINIYYKLCKSKNSQTSWLETQMGRSVACILILFKNVDRTKVLHISLDFFFFSVGEFCKCKFCSIRWASEHSRCICSCTESILLEYINQAISFVKRGAYCDSSEFPDVQLYAFIILKYHIVTIDNM